MIKIKVTNIPRWVSDLMLKQHFNRIGKITKTVLFLDKNTKSSGTAEIEFAMEASEEQQKKIMAMNNSCLDNSVIGVEIIS